MKKVIVTGGAGYIGSHTVVDLYNSGYIPIIIDNLCNSSKKNLVGINNLLGTDIKWYNIDCTDFDLMQQLFRNETGIFGCIHFAAYKSVEESVRNPEMYYENNIGSLKVLIDCMKMFNIDNLIFSSSCTVYGTPDKLPVDEKADFKKPESPYAESKQKCEELISKSTLNSISLRYFNPIGSHSSSLIGDCSTDNPSNLVPIIVQVASGKREKIIVNGKDYNTSDGTCVRDYIHVQDLASAHVNALKYLRNKKGKFAFNVGTGEGKSVLELIHLFEKSNNVSVNYEIGPRRAGDVEKIFSNDFLVKNELKWKPTKSTSQALIDAWNWEKKRKKI